MAPSTSDTVEPFNWYSQTGLDLLASLTWKSTDQKPTTVDLPSSELDRMTCPEGWSYIFQSSNVSHPWPSTGDGLQPQMALTCCPPDSTDGCKTLPPLNRECEAYINRPAGEKDMVKGFSASPEDRDAPPWRSGCCPVGYTRGARCELSEEHVVLRSRSGESGGGLSGQNKAWIGAGVGLMALVVITGVVLVWLSRREKARVMAAKHPVIEVDG